MVNLTKFKENKDLIQISNLSEEESKYNYHLINIVRALYAYPPHLGGVLITTLIFLVHHNTFALFETLATPLVTDIEFLHTTSLNFSNDFSNALFICMGLISLFTFYLFQKLYTSQKIDKLSDRAYVFATLVFGLIGSLLLIDY